MRTLIIDNIDSFTWNLVAYVEEITGTTPTVIRHDEVGWDAQRVALFDAVVISPGPGRPEVPTDIGICLEVLQHAHVPILGVCLGHQALGFVHGAEIALAPEPVHGRVFPIAHDGAGIFVGLPPLFDAVRYHSLVVTSPSPELEVTATTADGLIMGLRHRKLPQWGVQFHPESIGGEHGHAIIANFLRLAKQWNIQHRSRWRLERQSIQYEVDAAAIHAELFSRSEYSFWLDSTAPERETGRFSFLGDASGPLSRVWTDHVGDGSRPGLLDELAQDLAENTIDAGDLDIGFALGWVGWLGYELKAECGGNPAHVSPHPDLALIFADRAIVIDHVHHCTHIIALLGSEHDEAQRQWCEQTASQITLLGKNGGDGRAPGKVSALTARHERDTYLGLVEESLALIRQGETYEVCLTNQLQAAGKLDVHAAYSALRVANPTPFGALLRMGDISVLSCTPERFLSATAEGQVESRPIKGTRPRSADPHEDTKLKDSLARDEKDRAENLMIVDLVRNDLTRIAVPGTVRATELFQVESYATVHQLVSTVSCQLAPDLSVVDVLRATFPGGSMTGAPKIRTMEIIDRLEGGPRGVYSGAIGYFSLDGAMDLSMVIRTIVADPHGVTYGVGGAIIALSNPVDEYEETRTKSAPILRLLGQDFPE